jgi:hypothetical protein
MMRSLIPAGLLAVAFATPAFAQAPAVPASDLMLSWRSNALSPEGYAGRVASPPGGSVLLLAEALVNGRPADLRGYEVRWFINDDLYQSGQGLFSTIYRVPEFSDDLMDVRVQIIGAPFAATETSITVPLTNPTVVIEAAGGNNLRSGNNFFYATPYSFNVGSPNDLVYTWTVNGEVPEASGDPRELSITVEGILTQPIQLGLRIGNALNEREVATRNLELIPMQ